MSDSTAIDTLSAKIDDCWNRIGVRGDQSCEKLREHIHCRNCEVYSDAAQRILQRSIPENYQREWSQHFAQEHAAPVVKECSAMVFRIGREWLALPTSVLSMVAEVVTAHSIPHRSDPVLKGLVNIGGSLFPCMSLAHLLGIDGGAGSTSQAASKSARHSYARLMVTEFAQQKFALPVDDVHGIEHYAAAALEAVPATMAAGLTSHLAGILSVGDLRIGCLDHELIAYKFTRILR